MSQVSRLGLEPRTYGLTYRTGFHPPACCRCGLDFIISLSTTWGGAARKVSEDPARRQFPADCPIRRIVTHRRRVPTALRVFQQTGRFYLGPFGSGTPILKSVALPTELPALQRSSYGRPA